MRLNVSAGKNVGKVVLYNPAFVNLTHNPTFHGQSKKIHNILPH